MASWCWTTPALPPRRRTEPVTLVAPVAEAGWREGVGVDRRLRRHAAQISQEISFADCDAAVPQDVVRGGQVKEEVGQREMGEVISSIEPHPAAAQLERDHPSCRTLELRDLQ